MRSLHQHGLVVVILVLVAMVGCRKAPLSNQARIWIGVDLHDTCRMSTGVNRIPALQSGGIFGLMINLAIHPESKQPTAGYQYYLAHPMDTLVKRLSKHQLPFGVRITLAHDSIPIPISRIDDWFTDLSGLLLRSSAHPPSWILFSGPWVEEGWKKDALKAYIRSIRSGWDEFEGEIWLESPESDKREVKAPAKGGNPDAWVQSIQGFPSEQHITQIRQSFRHDPRWGRSLRVISLAPSWSGMFWRIEPWITEQEGLSVPGDVLLSGAPCTLFPPDKELEKLRARLRIPTQ